LPGFVEAAMSAKAAKLAKHFLLAFSINASPASRVVDDLRCKMVGRPICLYPTIDAKKFSSVANERLISIANVVAHFQYKSL
jgi:hypothetical protein